MCAGILVDSSDSKNSPGATEGEWVGGARGRRSVRDMKDRRKAGVSQGGCADAKKRACFRCGLEG